MTKSVVDYKTFSDVAKLGIVEKWLLSHLTDFFLLSWWSIIYKTINLHLNKLKEKHLQKTRQNKVKQIFYGMIKFLFLAYSLLTITAYNIMFTFIMKHLLDNYKSSKVSSKVCVELNQKVLIYVI